MKKLNYKIIIKYAAYFVALTVLARATTKHGLVPFALGFYAALLFSKQNIYVLSPMYVVASVLANPSWTGIIYGVTPVIVFTLAYFIHYKTKKPPTLTLVNAYVAISQIPKIALGIFHGDGLTAAVEAIVTQIFAYCAIIIVYAILIRGLKYKFTIDEVASGAVTATVFSLAFYQLDVYGFRLFFALAAFIVMFAVYSTSAGNAVVLAAVIGLGASLSDGNIGIAAALVVWASVAAVFRRGSIYLAGAALILSEAVLAYYFGAYNGYSYFNLIGVGVGVLAFTVIPRKQKSKLAAIVGSPSEGFAEKTIVNRNRMDVASRLYSIADIFLDMQEVLRGDVRALPAMTDSKERLSKDIALSYCGKCPDCEGCFKALGGDTSGVLEGIVENVIAKGRVTIIDMPPFITSRCRRVSGLIAAINENAESYKSYLKLSESMDSGKLLLAGQMGGTAEILGNLAGDIKKTLSFNSSKEKLIIDELAYHNIVCDEAMVYGDTDFKVTVVVREEDAEKKVLSKLVGKVLRCKLTIEGDIDYVGDKACVHLTAAPRYDLVFGEALKSGGDSELSGDSRSIQKIGVDKVIFALCDGMGKGSEAERNSRTAISMIENFYRAGFDNKVILSLVNKLLSLKNEENFSSLDMCIIDLKTGGADIIKMGAADGFLIRENKIEIIESRALPIGIVDDARPTIERLMMFQGDMLLLVSDGVTDVLLKEGVCDLIKELNTTNPQTLADAVIEKAARRGASDDITAFCARLYSK